MGKKDLSGNQPLIFRAVLTGNRSYQLAYVSDYVTDKNMLIFARIVVSEEDVPSTLQILKRGCMMRLYDESDQSFLMTVKGCQVLRGTNHGMGLLTCIGKEVFSTQASQTYIVGKSIQDIKDHFAHIINRKPVMSHPEWDSYDIFTELGLVKTCQSVGNVLGVLASWDVDKYHEHLSRLVKTQALTI